MKLGFNTQGTEKDFEEMLLKASDPQRRFFSYVEIGIANCQTFFAVAGFLKENFKDFKMVGIDIPTSPYFCPKEFMEKSGLWQNLNPCVGFFKCIPLDTSMVVQLGHWRNFPEAIDFCMIDGCHGANCAKMDFEGIEEQMEVGGIVAFHDASEPEQGTQHQPHCGEGIAVRRALKELGLLDDTRPGWKFLKESPGDYKNGGHGFVFVQKV